MSTQLWTKYILHVNIIMLHFDILKIFFTKRTTIKTIELNLKKSMSLSMVLNLVI